jgi:hypothetical protein
MTATIKAAISRFAQAKSEFDSNPMHFLNVAFRTRGLSLVFRAGVLLCLHVRAVLDIAPGPSWSYDSGSQASYAAATSFLFKKAYFASRDTGGRLGLLGLRSAR